MGFFRYDIFSSPGVKLTYGKDGAVQGTKCAAGKRLQLGEQMSPCNNRIDTKMRGCAVTALTLDTNADRIGGRMGRSVDDLHLSHGQLRVHVTGKNGFYRLLIKQTGFQHRFGAGSALLCGLKEEKDFTAALAGPLAFL